MKIKQIKLTEKQKEIIRQIDHPFYTEDVVEEWINRHDDVNVNAFAALQAMGAKGFYAAVVQCARKGWSV